ncbi:MAG: polysaccharide export protein [Alphaproteobacteria bacterium]|nr:polysaccharide export protein [Alphaproteobacteria bacterium]
MIGSITLASLRRIAVSAATIVVVGSGPVLAQQAAPQSAAVAPPGQAAPAQQPDYRLGPGDRLRIIVFGQKDMTGEFAVDGTGLMSFPLIGQIKAGGLTAEGLEREITDKLKPDYLRDPKVSVVVLTYRPFYIVGEVKTPGSYAYVTGMSVINAIALAGGFTYRAKESSFYVDRTAKDGKKTRIDAGPDTTVQPGDVITVRERYF